MGEVGDSGLRERKVGVRYGRGFRNFKVWELKEWMIRRTEKAGFPDGEIKLTFSLFGCPISWLVHWWPSGAVWTVAFAGTIGSSL